MSDSIRMPAGRPEPSIHVTFEGRSVPCHRGETLATALLAHGITRFGSTRDGAPRQPLCNMGTCFDCAVTVDGVPLVRACLTYVRPNMDVQPSQGW